MHFFDAFQVLIVSSDVCVVDVVSLTCVGEKDLQFTALGVDVVMTTGTDMGNQCTRFLLYINLDTVDITVAQIGDREVDNTVSAQERESSDRTIILESLYPDISG